MTFIIVSNPQTTKHHYKLLNNAINKTRYFPHYTHVPPMDLPVKFILNVYICVFTSFIKLNLG